MSERRIQEYFAASSAALAACVGLAPEIQRAAELVVTCLASGGAVYWCGNGGSASDAEHLAAELVGRFAKDRAPLRSFALTTNSSVTLAIGNDYGFEHVFSRQLAGVARQGDVLFAISTSGRSPNVIEAVRTARTLGVDSVGLTGASDNPLLDLCDLRMAAPSLVTSHVQECHIAIGQLICGLVEQRLFPD